MYSCISLKHFTLCRYENDLSISELIQTRKALYLPTNSDDKVWVVVRRKHVVEDTLHQMRCGLNTSKHLKVRFVGEPGVDTGSPMREYLNILMSSVARNNAFFSGENSRRVPMQNVVELERKTFFHIGCIFALSLAHGGPSPAFLSPSVVDYIVRGSEPVSPSIEEIPILVVKKESLEGTDMHAYVNQLSAFTLMYIHQLSILVHVNLKIECIKPFQYYLMIMTDYIISDCSGK